jgi:hypothetical protein
VTDRIRPRIVRSAAVATIAIAGLTACSAEEPRSVDVPPGELEAVAIGTNLDVGEIKIRSLLVVATDEGEPGRLLGNIFNPTDAAVGVVIADEDDSVEVVVPPLDVVAFDEEETVLDSVAEIPGSFVPITVTAEGVEVEDRIPVVDGSLDWYQPYVPGGS